MSETVAPNRDARPYPNPAVAWYVVGVFFVAYTFSYVDRTILTLLVAPIRASLQISDTQISLLHGLAFAVFYTLLGIPIGRLADRHHRLRIMAFGVFFWSLMTALCGLARNFAQMFLARVGVGVGEAALSPSAYSILADYFPPTKLAQAMSVYTAAMYIGSGLALIAGGTLIAMVGPAEVPFVGHLEPWQVVFLWVGLPGLLVVLLLATVREPERRGVLPDAGAMSVGAVARYLVERRGAYGLMMAGYAAFSMAYNGVNAWAPTFFMRVHHWAPKEIGLAYGLVLGVLGTAGILCGGWTASRLKASGRPAGNVQAGLIATLICFPTGVIAPLLGNAWASLALYAVFVFGASFPFGAAGAAFQEITPNQMRGQVTAIYFFFLNLAGIGIGPTVVALLTDRLFQNDAAVGTSNAIVVAVLMPIACYLFARALKPFARHVATAEF
jgi:MFS family permease